MSDGGGRLSTSRGALARAGLATDRAVPLLEQVGLWSGGELAPEAAELVGDLSEVADPDDALRILVDLIQAQPHVWEQLHRDSDWRRRVVAVAGASPPLGELLARHEDAVRALRTLTPVVAESVAARVEEAVSAAGDEHEAAAGIASIRRRATADIAARDLTGAVDVAEVAAELSGLAEGVLTGALSALHRQLGASPPAARIGVIGMGKLGGHELNYVSDVDVIFVHAPTGDEAAARDEAEHVCSQLLRLLNASTTMGRAYEVDPTLRPEGRQGPLSRTVDSFVAYWERWAKTWEFQALMKARPVAGDRRLGRELLERAEPYVWPDELNPGVVQEVRDMKGRVESKPEVRRHGDRQVKLGPGGLRDIEFAVQLLQLVHGRADRDLRVPGTLPALEALAAGGYVAEDDAATFALAYRELRTVEHRLQLAQERRTHTIPDDPDRQEWLARCLGYRAEAQQPAREPFLRRLRSLQAEVRELHAKLFYRPLLEAYAAVPAADAGIALGERFAGLGEEAARTRLEALGFRDNEAALRHVRAMTAGVSRRARALQAVLPAMLHVLAESPDPDTGLRMLRTVVEGQTADELLAELRDHPPAADLLARILGTSEVAGELFASVPQGADWLTDPSLREQPRTAEELTRLAERQLGWHEDLRSRSEALRRFKRRELLRVIMRDVAGAAPVSMVGQELAGLGQACVEAALTAVIEDLGGAEPPARIAVIGMGKLGGRELHYCSDLDVLFVHEPQDGTEDHAAAAWAKRVAELLLPTLSEITAEGTAFEIDAELRPEGRRGPLSRSLDSFRAYYERWSEPWEHQSLLRARPIAGDPGLGRRFVELVEAQAYPQRLEPAVASALRRLKARMERERLPRRGDPKRNLKLGPGGLTDVEWTVQLLQQRHGHRHPGLRTPSTMEALDGLEDHGLLESGDASWLRNGYRFLSGLRNHLYLLRERSVDLLPTATPNVERLARSLGYGRGGHQQLEDEYLRVTRRVRRVVERVFYESDGM